MMRYEFEKKSSVIAGNSDQGKPVFTRGNPPSFIGIPPEMTGSTLTFLGSFDGWVFFPVLGYDGRPISLSIRVQQPAKNPILNGSSAIIPVAQTEVMEGIQVLQPVSNAKEMADRNIDFYFVDDVD